MSQNNALVEIALALAMAFFSIMVLAMVSMGVPEKIKQSQKSLSRQFQDVIKLHPSNEHKKATSNTGASGQIKRDELIIFYRNKFFDPELQEVSAQRLGALNIKVVAVEPSIPAVEALKVRKMFGSNSVVVTLLDDKWLARLKEK